LISLAQIAIAEIYIKSQFEPDTVRADGNDKGEAA